MLRIRLMRIGRKHRPFYRIVVVDSRRKRSTGKYVALLGTYDPFAEKERIKINMEEYREWLKKGAQPSEAVLRLVLSPEEKRKRWPDKSPTKQGEGEDKQTEEKEGKESLEE